MMIDRITFPVPENENQKKLFEELKFCCKLYDKSLQELNSERKNYREQAYGMVQLYANLFPKEFDKIDRFWRSKLMDYLSR